jgi:nucleotide-binding universal stress UspA family protein
VSSESKQVVVVGVDGSTCSNRAVEWADQYAAATGADLRLVTAWQWAMAYGAPMMFDGYDPSADAEAIAEKARANVTLPADRVEVVVPEDKAGPALVTASKEAQLLVVGSHGHNVVSTVLLGSVSGYCVHHATCPVTIVR